MSFQKAAESLGASGLPLFVTMASQHKAIPMQVGIHSEVLRRLDPKLHRKAKKALAQIAYSETYLAALRVAGAQRHDVDGNVIEPVTEAVRESARARLKEMMRARASAA
jgi:sRNA-binding protein